MTRQADQRTFSRRDDDAHAGGRDECGPLEVPIALPRRGSPHCRVAVRPRSSTRLATADRTKLHSAIAPSRFSATEFLRRLRAAKTL